MEREIKITALLSWSYAWARINGWGLHARHESAGPLPFSERDKKRLTLFGWRFKLLGPLHRTAPPTQRPVVCRSQAQSEIWGRILSAAEKLRSDQRGEGTQPAPRYDEVFAKGQQWLDEQVSVPCEDPDCLGPLPGESQATHARRTAEDLRSAAAPSDQDQALRGEATSPTASLTVEYLRQLLLSLVQATGWAERHTALGEGEPRWYCRYCHATAHRQGVGKHWTFVCAHSEDCPIKPVLDALEDRVSAARGKR